MFFSTSESGKAQYKSWDLAIEYIIHRWQGPHDKYMCLDDVVFVGIYWSKHPTMDGFIAFFHRKLYECGTDISNVHINSYFARVFITQTPRRLGDAILSGLTREDLQRFLTNPDSEKDPLTLERVQSLFEQMDRNHPEFLKDKTLTTSFSTVLQPANPWSQQSGQRHDKRPKHDSSTPNTNHNSDTKSKPWSWSVDPLDPCVKTDTGFPAPVPHTSKNRCYYEGRHTVPVSHKPEECKARLADEATSGASQPAVATKPGGARKP